MPSLLEIQVPPLPLSALAPYLGEAAVGAGLARARAVRAGLGAGPLWNVNSTALGGGVAEMLRPLLGYARGAGLDARWLVIPGSPAFFKVTKRLHNALHGQAGDGSPLGPAERRLYAAALAEQAGALLQRVRPGEVVLLHDPQTAGLAPHLAAAGARVVWRCHIGADRPSPQSERAWAFLAPDLAAVGCAIFSRWEYVPRGVLRCPVRVVQPSIDPCSAKNRELEPARVQALLAWVGLLAGPRPPAPPRYPRQGGGWAEVRHLADVTQLGPPPAPEAPLVVQVSRWDRLKDPIGVMRGFARLVEAEPSGGAELLLAGPNVRAVSDDPDGAAVFAEVLEAWRCLPHPVRQRVHLASLPSHEVEENAVLVNALQRHAAVVVQKSLQEGFGLTVTEAMWKARPVLASGVGGIRDQLRDGEEGLLLRDPTDPDEFAHALGRLLGDPALARRLGRAARERVREHFLPLRHLLRYAAVIEELLLPAGAEARPAPG